MEILINGLLGRGARRDRLEAKLFGGARMIAGLTDIGQQNAEFAERFLKQEGIPVIGGSLRGHHARRIQFWPNSGRVRQMAIANADAERQRILTEARSNAATLKAQIIAKADSDAADVRARGAADAEASKAQATSDLQTEIGSLALGAAEAVVANALDAATQSELIDNYISKVGA
jgi:hypothetical protein